jgi:uncharacterized protein (DUF433 family)
VNRPVEREDILQALRHAAWRQEDKLKVSSWAA